MFALLAGNQQQTRPASGQNVYNSYDPTPSPIAYGSPSQASTGSVMNRIGKTNTTSPTPAQTAWSLRQVKYCHVGLPIIIQILYTRRA